VIEKYKRIEEIEKQIADNNHILGNTNNDCVCKSCGQMVDIEVLKNTNKTLTEELVELDKQNTKKQKELSEINQVKLIQQEKERELLKTKINSIKLLEEDKYSELNALFKTQEETQQKILTYMTYVEKTTPLVLKLSELRKNIKNLEEGLLKPTNDIDTIEEKIKINVTKIEKANEDNNNLVNELKFISDYQIAEETKLVDILMNNEKTLSDITKTIETLTNKITKVNELQKEKEKILTKKEHLNNELAKYKNYFIRELELKEKIKEFDGITMEQLEEVKTNYQILKKHIENETIKIVEYKKDLELINLKLDEYNKTKEKMEELEDKLFIYTKIKNYSDRIKKASISEFFNSISDFINKIISSEKGTMSNMKLKISQKNNAKTFDILVENGDVEVKDISLLSGAEQGTVARAIYFALAQFSNFGIVWLDECDGMLSDTNKEVFLEMLIKMKELIGLNQIFLISHNQNLIYKTDLLIDLNKKRGI
jgi:DNA repair exonuclease SbcCD ATPase subunit